MTDINLKTLSPDTSLPTTGFLFGADSQASTNPSVYSTQTVATTLLGSTSLTGDTVATSLPVLDLSQTWNSSGTTFTGVRFNAAGTSDANSAAASLLMDLQVNTASKLKVKKDGTILFGGSVNGIGINNNVVQLGNPANAAMGVTGTSSAQMSVNAQFGFAQGNPASYDAPDTILTRKAAANLRFGAADAVTPVAQTLSVQSVVAGTTDGVGQPFTFTGSQSTGTGVPGNILIQTASSAATTGSAQNALATVATFGPSTLRLAQTTPALDLAQTWNTSGTPTALKVSVTDTASNAASLLADFQISGNSVIRFLKDRINVYYGANFLGAQYGTTEASWGISATSIGAVVGNYGIYLANDNFIQWNNTNSSPSVKSGLDLFLSRRGTANLRLGKPDAASPAAQTLSVQSIVGGGGTPNLSAAAYPFTITGAQGTGQGAGGSIIFQTAPAAVSSGNGQNGLTDTLTLDSVGSVRVVRALTVATLPGTPLAGMIARVSDALAPAIGTTVAAGGAAYALVNYNGANWTVIGV